MSSLATPENLVLIAAVFAFAGAVKGVIGLGLPSISLALLATAFTVPQAMALLLAPSFVTNLWQALAGGWARRLLLRLWPFFLMATVTVWLGAMVLTRVEGRVLSILLGTVLVAYATISLCRIAIAVPRREERRLGALLGGMNGVVTGMTGSSVVPGVLYLQAIGLPRDQLVQAMGILFTLSAVALALALRNNAILTGELATLSAAATLPALLGNALGQRWRRRLPEASFRRVFFVALLLLGLYIAGRALA